MVTHIVDTVQSTLSIIVHNLIANALANDVREYDDTNLRDLEAVQLCKEDIASQGLQIDST